MSKAIDKIKSDVADIFRNRETKYPLIPFKDPFLELWEVWKTIEDDRIKLMNAGNINNRSNHPARMFILEALVPWLDSREGESIAHREIVEFLKEWEHQWNK